MSDVYFINRKTKQQEKEQILCKTCLEMLYHKNPFSWFFRTLLCKLPIFSRIFGRLQMRPSSRKKIQPFIQKYSIDAAEFLDPPETFPTFNDFFIRKLKPSARPISNGNDVAILPADGRYLVFQNIHHEEGFLVKGKKFSLEALLGDSKLAHKYAHGTLIMIRLAPVDYHRFHFPCNCVPGEPKLINGPLFSVNPIAIRKNIDILTENKRVITHLKTHHFGTVLFTEVGATNVGSIIQTFEPEKHYAKGDEKGYFSFGGSCILILFEPARIQLDQDLIQNTQHGFETLGNLGQTLGRALSPI
ncbi:MAG: Phosphatidylserine decarboxylase proenzyme [Chlamydiae bacterium]|nr:Phosphatidylserine decarboxylase proenzyme [Chlamydiota bacterium]